MGCFGDDPQPQRVVVPPGLAGSILNYFDWLRQGGGEAAATSRAGQPHAASRPVPAVATAVPAGYPTSLGQPQPVNSPPRMNPAAAAVPTYASLGFDPNGIGQFFQAGMHPLDAYAAANDVFNEADSATRKLYPNLDDRHNGEGDAFRHAYWSYLVAKKFGADQAKNFGDLHEIWIPNPDSERLMDLYNNKVGRGMAASGGDTMSPETFQAALRKRDIRSMPY